MVEARILIADDSKMNQQILSEILGVHYEYLYADDGLQALELLHSEFDIDLLLLDINMPRLDGFGVLEVMKQRNWLQEIPVIITSSEDDESFIQKAYELGVTDYIRRPFNLTVTQRRVSNALTLYARQKHLVHLAEEQVYEREKTNSAIINILSHVVESRNFESGTHILHVPSPTFCCASSSAHLGTARKTERKHHGSQQISPSRARRSGGDDAARRLQQQGRPRIFPGEPCQYHDLDVL